MASAVDMSRADMAVVVKRVPDVLLRSLKGRLWVWDVVDAYPQPSAYEWSREQAVAWVRAEIARLNPTAIIWPTAQMRADCDRGLPGMVLPHHHRPGIKVNPVRKHAQAVAYEGAAQYLGSLRAGIESLCERRGWRFVVNPDHLAEADIVLGMRDSGGYVSRHWKSNVKLANAHGSGTPFIGNRECGYRETRCGVELWADDLSELAEAFDRLTDQSAREVVSDRFLASAYSVDQAAKDLQQFIDGL
jgi:hypothetical protein